MNKKFATLVFLSLAITSLAACGAKSNPSGQSSSSSSEATTSRGHEHIPGGMVEENRIEATCLEDGSYDVTVHCIQCRALLSQEHFVIPAKGHELEYFPAKEATCTEVGWSAYEACKNCSYSTYQEIPATGHLDIATREENRVEPTCIKDGRYDLVHYCTIDQAVISTERVIIPANGHTLIHHEGKEATCTEIGYHAYDTCAVCDYSTYVEIPATGHLHLAKREENRVEATCESDGSYDLVTYCIDDDVVISNEHITIDALGHDLTHHDGKDPTNTEDGWKPYDTCSRCDYTTYEAIPHTGPVITAQKATQIYDDYVDRSVYTLSSTPSIGQAKILVIPVWFTESSDYIALDKRENVREDIQTAYFGTNEETGWRSVKTYYEEESHGALTLTGTVSDWYEGSSTSPLSLADYASSDGGSSNTSSLVKKAVNWYFKNHDDSRTDYDCNHDGYLDGVMLIYGAPDYRTSGQWSQSNFWAYCYWVQDANQKKVSSPGPNAYFWASYDFMYSGSRAYERTGKSNYGGGDVRYVYVDTHTYIHEMGHMFGLSDYYDYSSLGYSPAAGFSMQDYNVGGHDPFSSFSLGWGQAYIPDESISIDLKPFTQSGEMIILSPSWNNYNSAFDEYLILEYYTPDGLNKMDHDYTYSGSYPTGSGEPGIRLWHVDARLITYSNYSYSSYTLTSNTKAGVGVLQAMSNTYYDGSNADHVSPLGSSYAEYNLLQLIRNNKTISHKTKKSFDSSDLFYEDETFTMDDYSSQFVKGDSLNKGAKLGFSFTVNNITSEKANITVTKL